MDLVQSADEQQEQPGHYYSVRSSCELGMTHENLRSSFHDVDPAFFQKELKEQLGFCVRSEDLTVKNS
jgi:hypothetical protein